MKVLFDTSVLVAAIVDSHPAHKLALPWLQQVQTGTLEGIISAHTVAELYAILTRLPVRPRISAQLAQQSIQRNIRPFFTVVSLSDIDYFTVIDHLSNKDIIGGATYDALIVYVALKTHVDQIVTLNAKDFRRLYPSLASRVVTP